MAYPTTYCSVSDVESILSAPGVTAFMDDDNDTTRDASETTDITNAIERAASLEINFMLAQRYGPVDMAGNVYLKWANATIAAYYVVSRRNQSAAKTLVSDVERIRKQLREVRDHIADIADLIERFDDLPCVSNFEPERWRNVAPIRVVTPESTREAPHQEITRNVASDQNWIP